MDNKQVLVAFIESLGFEFSEQIVRKWYFLEANQVKFKLNPPVLMVGVPTDNNYPFSIGWGFDFDKLSGNKLPLSEHVYKCGNPAGYIRVNKHSTNLYESSEMPGITLERLTKAVFRYCKFLQ